VALLTPALAPAQLASPRSRDAVASYLAPYVAMHDLSGTVLIVKVGTDSLVWAAGSADRERGIAAAPETRYGIGSLTKTFTAAAIVMLAERGKLSLADTVGKFIPAFPHGGEITLTELLEHSAGVPDYHNLPDYARRRSEPTTLAQFASWIGTKPLDFRPGAKSSYSSSGYALLAYVIERVSGMRYAEFLRQNVFEPLGMRSSGDLTDSVLPPLAKGYDPGFPPEGIQAPPVMSATWLEGSGSLYSTVSDLATWARAVTGNRLFHFSALPYPYGWGQRKWWGRDVIEQDGRIALGYTAHISIYPKDSVIIVILSNIQSAATDRMRMDLGALVFHERYQAPTLRPIAMPGRALLAAYTGRYEVAPGFVMSVRAQGSNLALAGPEGDYLPLDPESDTEFFFRALYVPIHFERDSTGRVVDLNWNNQFTCKRIE
jgi:CubicO group peptidase (beta-lactamase class C family)